MKKTLSIYSLLGLIFGILGTAFSVAATIINRNMEAIKASPNSQGNVEIIPSVFFLVGISFLMVALILYMINYKKNRLKEVLKERGIAVWARVDSIDQNVYVNVNHVHPYIIKASYEDPETGERHEFRSENILGDASSYLGQDIRVFVDKNDYKCYYVDVDENRIVPIR